MIQLIDNELGSRVKTVGGFYSDILKNLFSVFYSGCSRAEDVQTHLGNHLKTIPGNSVPSADTILHGIKELQSSNIAYTSKQNQSYNLNINIKLNGLNIKSLLLTGQLKKVTYCDFGWKHLPCSFLNENTVF
jgi:hypothetical protein